MCTVIATDILFQLHSYETILHMTSCVYNFLFVVHLNIFKIVLGTTALVNMDKDSIPSYFRRLIIRPFSYDDNTILDIFQQVRELCFENDTLGIKSHAFE
jgi:hypothetical protein